LLKKITMMDGEAFYMLPVGGCRQKLAAMLPALQEDRTRRFPRIEKAKIHRILFVARRRRSKILLRVKW
jgi:hypothetical protein